MRGARPGTKQTGIEWNGIARDGKLHLVRGQQACVRDLPDLANTFLTGSSGFTGSYRDGEFQTHPQSTD